MLKENPIFERTWILMIRPDKTFFPHTNPDPIKTPRNGRICNPGINHSTELDNTGEGKPQKRSSAKGQAIKRGGG